MNRSEFNANVYMQQEQPLWTRPSRIQRRALTPMQANGFIGFASRLFYSIFTTF